jgi:inosose dehydratase
VQRRKDRALQFGAGPGVLRPESWDRLAHGIERLASLADDHGIDLVYHPHMGTVVQEETQVAELVLRTSPRVRLTADTGHIRFAGDDPVAFLERYLDRVGLVHLKDVRLSRVERFSAFRASFYQAVVGGVFTVPGDGDLDFDGIFDVLRRRRYDGWVIVEAEQDPEKADPLVYSTKGRDTVRAGLGV